MEVISIKNPILNLLVLGWICMGCISFGVKDAAAAPYASAMFVFGDSLADVGNNNFIPGCKVLANFTPYGISAFPQPTGRFSNGLIVIDYIASFLGLPCPPPLLSPGASFSGGVNFASGGSGLLDTTGKGMNMTKHFHGAEEAESRIAKSLFCISAGSNDFVNYLTNSTAPSPYPTHAQLVTMLLKKYDQHLLGLYKSGARKFLVLDVSALGCTPYARRMGLIPYAGHCVRHVNNLTKEYNNGLRKLVDRWNQNLDGASVILLNSYAYVMNMIKHGESYGFSETRIACCGSGSYHVAVLCGMTTPPAKYCNDPDTYLFWDKSHPTQKAVRIIARAIWTGNSSVIQSLCSNTGEKQL